MNSLPKNSGLEERGYETQCRAAPHIRCFGYRIDMDQSLASSEALSQHMHARPPLFGHACTQTAYQELWRSQLRMPPIIIVVEGTFDVSAICADAMAKLYRSPKFENSVVWIQRTEEEPVGLLSERSVELMRAIQRYEFDVHLKRRIQSSDPHTLFILSHLYDVGFWRKASEFGIKPDVVFYVEGMPPREDLKQSKFFKFMQSMGIRNARFIPNNDEASLKIITYANEEAEYVQNATV